MTQHRIENPILRGFNPDPAICRVNDDYYIVTSTFEWFPGYQIHHSRDLVNWQLIGQPLKRVSQLDMRGVPDSCGVWAPCLTHHDGVFYLLYTNVQSFQGPWKDMPNYLVTTSDIRGDWSEPTFLNSSGFDASLFHDDDGRCWLVNMLMDHRNNRFFGGIVLQEFDRDSGTLLGHEHYIFEGTEHGRTEGPHLYKRNGWYYLLLAEGGTGYEHCMTVARSRSITGPYEVHPQNPLLTAKYDASQYLQKTGHGGLVETQTGEWYVTFLTSRPIAPRGRCTLGRESGLERITWDADDWPRLASGLKTPRRYVEAPDLPAYPFDAAQTKHRFFSKQLDLQFQTLRMPITDDWASLSARAGHLRLRGRQSLSSTFEQSLIARRVQSHHCLVSTALEFRPETFQQMAGLVAYYNTLHFHYLQLRGDDFGRKAEGLPARRYLLVCSSRSGHFSEELEHIVDVTDAPVVHLRAEFDHADLQFYYSFDGDNWTSIGPVLDGSILSDDFVEHSGMQEFTPCFTGAFFGLCCQDLSGKGAYADFSYFNYEEL